MLKLKDGEQFNNNADNLCIYLDNQYFLYKNYYNPIKYKLVRTYRKNKNVNKNRFIKFILSKLINISAQYYHRQLDVMGYDLSGYTWIDLFSYKVRLEAAETEFLKMLDELYYEDNSFNLTGSERDYFKKLYQEAKSR